MRRGEDLPVVTAPAWREFAACKDADPDLFFPSQGQNGARAKAVCAECPVAAECLQWALVNNETIGVWGGTNERDRRLIRRRLMERGQLERKRRQITHGTSSGYRAHFRRGEDPCPSCKEAASRESAGRRANA